MRKGLARGQYLGNARLAPHKRVRAPAAHLFPCKLQQQS